jgi:hypothetical protein
MKTTDDEQLDLSERLRSLPAFDPPPGGWARLSTRLDQSQNRRRPAYAWLALAASVVAIVSIGLLPTVNRDAASPAPVPVAATGDVARLMQQSRSLESTLAQVKPQVAVWDESSAAQAARLERQLAIVDLQLPYAQPHDAQRLWQDRVALMSRLLRTHEDAALIPVSYNVAMENPL